MKVAEIAKRLGVTADTVRFYTRIGILNPTKSPVNGYRDYRTDDLSRLRFVLSARQLGFSVEDIQQILGHADNKESPCPTVRRLIDQRLHETEQRFQEVKLLRERMTHAVNQWSQQPDKVPDGDMICHLIEGFSQHASEEESS
jgi:DNA-binding transcriptional MerR regulator